MSSENQFREVGNFEDIWDCRKTGTLKENNRADLKADDKSWAHGYYLGCRDAEIKGKQYVIHKMKILAVGNPAHTKEIKDKENGEVREFFGTTVLNNELAKSIQPGQCIKVLWLGQQTPKTSGGSKYQGWKIFEDMSRPPINVHTQHGVASTNTSVGTTELAADLVDDDNDLPF